MPEVGGSYGFVPRAILLGATLVAGCTTGRIVAQDASVRDAATHVAHSLDSHGAVGSARVVGIGEGTHGTLEFRYLFASFVGTQLASSRELTVGLELDPVAGYLVNQMIRGCGYVPGGPGVPAPSWMTPADLELVRVLRDWNARGDGCARVIGLDAPVSTTAFMFNAFGPRCLGDAFDDELRRTVAGLEDLLRTDGSSSAARAEGLQRIEDVRAGSGSVDRCREFDWWVRLVKERLAFPVGFAKGLIPAYAHAVERDRIMAENVIYWAGYGRVFLLAHAGHVAKTVRPGRDGGTTMMGQRLAQHFGEAYVAIAMLFGSGTLHANACVLQRSASRRRIPAPRRPSLERDLAAEFTRPVILGVEEACRGRECDVLRIGYGYCLPLGWRDPRAIYIRIPAARSYDWVVFFPTGTAASPVKHGRS